MIMLSSYPRSGNTFFRNVLYHVYDIESMTYRQYSNEQIPFDSNTFPVVKTHRLPHQLPEFLQQQAAVYLIRDFRDCLISMANKRINKNDGLSPSFSRCFLEVIFAQAGAHFGGWSENVKQWSEKADIIIRFEDLIQNPIQEVEKVRSLLNLPQANIEQLPTFDFLKKGKGKYPIYKSEQARKRKANLFFRKGKIGDWKGKIPIGIYILLINFHGDMLEKMGYDLYPDSYKYCKIFKNSFVKYILRFYYSVLLHFGLV